MKNRISLYVILIFCFSYTANAQSVTKIDTLNGTELSISMDNRINADLESLEERCARTEDKTSLSTTTKKKYTSNRELTTEEVCRKNPRILGFKIQVGVAKNNAEANQLKADFRSKFPHLKTQTDASLRPNYRVLAGSYFTKESASSDLRK